VVRLHHPWSMLAGEGDGPMAMVAHLSRGSAGLIFVVVAAEAKVACCGCCVDGDGFMLRALSSAG
jgi:hypothetical protein